MSSNCIDICNELRTINLVDGYVCMYHRIDWRKENTKERVSDSKLDDEIRLTLTRHMGRRF
jgi:hypothetical protein